MNIQSQGPMEINGGSDESGSVDMEEHGSQKEIIDEYVEDQEAIPAKAHRTGLCNDIPSAQEVEDHMIGHLSYRSWCHHCVRGKGINAPHRKGRKEPREFNTVHIDYMFFEKRRNHEELGEYHKRAGAQILVMYDERNGLTKAHYVDKKGVSDWSIKVFKDFLEALGDKKVAIRSYQEPAILAFALEVKRHTFVDVID